MIERAMVALMPFLLSSSGCADLPASPVMPPSALLRSGFIFDKAPFDQCHASTIAKTRGGLAAAWYYSERPVSLEIWNEPNISQFWAPFPNPIDYRLLVDATISAVKGGNTGIPLVVGATSGCDALFLDQVFALPSVGAADAASIHPYRRSAPETFLQERLLVQDILRARTGRDDLPLYSGEWGYSSSWFGGRTEAAWNSQAVHAVRTILFNILNRVPKTVWYDLQDDGSDPSDPEHNFGLVTNGEPLPKPAYKAVQALTALLPGRDGNPPLNSWSVGAVSTKAHDVYGLVFHNDRGGLAVFWTGFKGKKVEIRMTGESSLQFFDMLGQPMTSVKKESGFCYFSLEGGAGPVYVKK